MKAVIMTHVDLDGVCSGYLAGRVFNTRNIYSCNYDRVLDTLKSIVGSGNTDHLIITDLNLTPKDMFYVIENFDRITVFDHHPSSKSFIKLQELEKKFKIYYDESYSTTSLVYNNSKDFDYDDWNEIDTHMVNLVNVYDLWMDDHELFKESNLLNEIYFKYGFAVFLEKLETHGSVIPRHFNREEIEYVVNSEKELKMLLQSAITFDTESGALMVFPEDSKVINHVSGHYPSSKGVYYVFFKRGDNKYGCSVRVRKDKRDKFFVGEELRQFQKTSEIIDSCGGHAAAAGITFKPNNNINDIVAEVERFDAVLEEAPF